MEVTYTSSFLTFAFLIFLYQRSPLLHPGLRKIPGPVWAKWSNLWRFIDTWRGSHEVNIVKLHDKYGNAVRVGPNVVSIADPDAIDKIYGSKTDFSKGEMYTVREKFREGKVIPTLTTLKDKKAHAVFKKPVVSAYSMTALTTFEPFLDRTICRLVGRLDAEFASGAKAGRRCDTHNWLQYFYFDVIGEITFGRSFGFLDAGRDVNRLIEAVAVETRYNALVSQMPVLDYWIRKNPISTRLGTATNPFALRASQLLEERLAEKEATECANRRDFVSHLHEYQRNHPGQLSNTAFFGHVMTNLLVGSDSTSVAIRAVIYYVLRTPKVLSTLQAELDAADLSYPVPWHASQDGLPYLDAVIKEALRFHPPGTLLLERIVPDTGLELSNGMTIPPGTIVGMNGWNIQRLPEVFGSDAVVFNPGRWLRGPDEDPAAFQERIQRMKRADFTFGHGPRGCVGKPIALMVLHKLVPTLFGLFDIQLAEPAKEWRIESSFFAKQYDMDVTFRWREGIDRPDWLQQTSWQNVADPIMD